MRRNDTYFLVGALSTVYFFSLAPLDPDFHHDGIQYAAAAGVAEGRNIHSQVFEQYGPITAWIQGLTLKIFGLHLYNLRLENAFLLTLSAILLLRILKTLNTPEITSVMITLGWVIACPVSSTYRTEYGYAFWPWPTVICLPLLLTIVSIFLTSHVTQKSLRKRSLFIVGGLTAVLLFTRIQVGIFTLIAISLLIFLGTGADPKSAKLLQWLKLILAFAGVSSIVVVYLALHSSLSAFANQVIFGSLHQYANSFSWKFYQPFFFFGPLPFLVGLIVATFAVIKFPHKISASVLAFLSAAFLFAGYIGYVDLAKFTFNGKALHFLFELLPLTFVYASFAVSVILFAYVSLHYFRDFFGLRKFFKRSSIQNTHHNSDYYVEPIEKPQMDDDSKQKFYSTLVRLLILTLPFLTQLYPMADQMHLWWAGPSIVVLIPYLLGELVSRKNVNLIVVSLLGPIILLGSFCYIEYLNIPRTRVILNESAVSQMKIRSNFDLDFLAINSVLSTLSPNSSYFDCNDGLFASWTGHYLAHDARYVAWAWGIDRSASTNFSSRYFFCGTEESANLFAQHYHVRFLGPGIPYYFGIFSNGNLYEYSQIPSGIS